MSLLKYIERLKRMDDFIGRKATGNAKLFAAKLGVSRSQLMLDIQELRILGAPVRYCHYRKTYYYENDVRLILDFVKDLNSIKGGRNYLDRENLVNKESIKSLNVFDAFF